MMTFLIGVFFALSNIPWADLTQAGPQPIAQEVISQAVLEGQRLSGQADGLVKAGHELEAARLYLAAHENYQKTILAYFEQGLRAGLGGGTADEDALMRAGGEVAELRNVNLSKLWIVLDPKDRAFEQGLERNALCCSSSLINLSGRHQPEI